MSLLTRTSKLITGSKYFKKEMGTLRHALKDDNYTNWFKKNIQSIKRKQITGTRKEPKIQRNNDSVLFTR